MTRYTVTIERSAAKALARAERRDRRRIEDAIDALADDPRPHGAIHLTGVDAYRVRVGDWRVVYTVPDAVRVVTVTNVGHRRSIYREV
ncbi:type II toxin-antitoxin system RelE family toxin [Propionicicella superfundia]|uniref:type II toxin-antitoxin system RelE family toxin n=1 Tax=Propionicicella superfundia TaxID=348582 RepID=UPI000426EBE8|nr:type II toxin-antitoxin system RelE/ParE family toxin [Propionicicella superfundia]